MTKYIKTKPKTQVEKYQDLINTFGDNPPKVSMTSDQAGNVLSLDSNDTQLKQFAVDEKIN